MKYTRIFTGIDKKSHFEECTFELSDIPIGKITEKISADCIYFGEIIDLAETSWHNPPVHQFIIMLQGAMEIEIGDGTKKTFNTGDILLAQDTTGQGHITRAASNGKRIYMVIPQHAESPFQFTFEPVVESQRELIHHWLKQGYIAKWIHGTGLQNTLNGLEKFLQYLSEGKNLDRQMTLTQHWIGYDGDKPIVYLLTSNIFKNEDTAYIKYSETNGPIITLDIFLGDPEYVGKGLAAPLIKEFLRSQCSDVKEVFIDPEQSNERAAHVYEKAGFKKVGEFIAPWHPVPHHIMRLSMKDLVPE